MRHSSVWLVSIAAAIVLSGCATEPVSGICPLTMTERDALTVALLDDGGPESRAAGRDLIQTVDAWCDDVG